jgi:hypothetical protein
VITGEITGDTRVKQGVILPVKAAMISIAVAAGAYDGV